MKQNTGHKLCNRLPAAAILLLGLLASCGNLLVPKASPPAESAASGDSAGNTGSILVSITFPNTDTGTSARTAMPAAPAYDGLNWSVSASDGTQTVQAQGAYPDLTISLGHEGTWTFTARAVNDAGYEIFYGQAIQEITHGNAAVTIVPGPGQAMQTGTGSIRLVIQVAAGAGVADVYYKLVPTGNTAGGGSSSITLLTGGGSGWTFSEPAIGAGTYLLYLYFTDSAGATVYTTAESVNVWNGMTTSRWVNTGGTRYLTDSGEFILTQDIIDTFIASVGETVYVSADGSDEQDGIGSVIAPVQTFSRAMELLSANGTVAVMGEVSADETMLSSGADITVQGASGGGALVNTDGRVFTVEAGASLTLGAGITLTGTNTADTGGDGMGGAVYVNGGELTMQSGSAITGSSADNGGGVYVFNGGEFAMEGGTISGNTSGYGGGVFVYSGTFTMNGGTFSSNTADNYGGGVYVFNGGEFAMSGTAVISDNEASYGGGVYVYSSTFTMNGGTFSSNTADNYGGGVYVFNGGEFAMSGTAVISDNEASYGGGVYVFNGEFMMNGGIISGNISNTTGGGVEVSNGTFEMIDGEITDNTASYGGGVHVSGTSSTFTMSGTAVISDNEASYGGGVFVNGGTFIMNGGEISGNTALSSDTVKDSGGGVYVYSGRFNMNGGNITQDNTPEPVFPDDWYDQGLGSWTAGTVGGVPGP